MIRPGLQRIVRLHIALCFCRYVGMQEGFKSTAYRWRKRSQELKPSCLIELNSLLEKLVDVWLSHVFASAFEFSVTRLVKIVSQPQITAYNRGYLKSNLRYFGRWII